MPRTDGRKLVALATAVTVGAIGVGTIYLPFVADRDKLRGMFEEGEDSIPEGARREIRAAMKADAERERKLQEQQQGQQQPQEKAEDTRQQTQRASAGSMWSSFRRNS